jgi:signal transduction histidine kinase
MAESEEDQFPGEVLRNHLERALSDARHTLSNPITVISGNTQLLLEMARMMDLDDEFVEPLEDIDEAVDELEAMIDEVYTAERLLGGPGAEGRARGGEADRPGGNEADEGPSVGTSGEHG